jgi:two-component system KDP operon response regulator KdpE
MRGKRILVIDDDAEMVELVRVVFTREGAEVYSAADGREGICQYGACRPDLILLDVMMPELDGWETCRLFREFTDVPIVFLTALGRNQEIVRGLDCGAVDYVTKPFSPNVLLARARAAMRERAAAQAPKLHPPTVFDDGYLWIDVAGHQVKVDGEPVSLTATEYRLLTYLVEHAGRVLTYEQILGHVWGQEYRDSVDYVHVYVSHLRHKIEWDPSRPAYVLTERGVGYRFDGKRPDRRGQAA